MKTLACVLAIVMIGVVGCGEKKKEVPKPEPKPDEIKIYQTIKSQDSLGSIWAYGETYEITTDEDDIKNTTECKPVFIITTKTILRTNCEYRRWSDSWREDWTITTLNIQKRTNVPLSEIATEKQRQLECAESIAKEAQAFLTEDKTIVVGGKD